MLALPVILNVTVRLPPGLVKVIVGATSAVPREEKVIVAADETIVTSEKEVWILTVFEVEPVICMVYAVGKVTT